MRPSPETPTKLSKEQAQAVTEYVAYLADGKTFYETAPPQVRDSIEQGRRDTIAGRVIEHSIAVAEIDAQIASARK